MRCSEQNYFDVFVCVPVVQGSHHFSDHRKSDCVHGKRTVKLNDTEIGKVLYDDTATLVLGRIRV